MKKLTIALACVIGMMFFASCDPDALNQIMEQLPEVEFVSDTNYVSGFSGFWVGEELHFQLRVKPNESSQSPIASVHFAIHNLNGDAVKTYDPEITDPEGENFFDVTFVSDQPSVYTVTAVVKDQAGKENATEPFTIDYVEHIESVIGTYQGDVEITGHVKSDKPVLGNTIDEDYTTGKLRTEIVLGQLAEDNRVVATFEIDGRPVSLYCTKTENGLELDEFHFNRLITLVCPIYLNITVNADATIDENGKMTLDGTANGAGAVFGIPLVNVTANLTGTISGDLNEVPVAE